MAGKAALRLPLLAVSSLAFFWTALRVFVPAHPGSLREEPPPATLRGAQQAPASLALGQQSHSVGGWWALVKVAGSLAAVGGLAACSAKATQRARVTRRAEGGAASLNPAEEPGATAPLGFFDPLGFTKNPLMTWEDDPTGFKFLRSAEIKHGRVAMMASLGGVVQHYFKFPLCEKVPAGMASLNSSAGSGGFTLLLLVVGIIEIDSYIDGSYRTSMGNFGDPFRFNNYNTEYRNKELNNGRMAMFAVMGQIVAEMTTGLDAIEQLGV